jgi:hypothetical protein
MACPVSSSEPVENLCIWLDHGSIARWTVVNERSVLAYIIAPLSAAMPSQLRHITVNLPNLNPRLENPERHFTERSVPPPNPIRTQRRKRQRYFAHETRIPGYFEITGEYDFPFMWEISYYILPWNESFEDCEEERESCWIAKAIAIVITIEVLRTYVQ